MNRRSGSVNPLKTKNLLTDRTVHGTSLGKLDDVGEWPRGVRRSVGLFLCRTAWERDVIPECGE
jgi:hypothetical protein